MASMIMMIGQQHHNAKQSIALAWNHNALQRIISQRHHLILIHKGNTLNISFSFRLERQKERNKFSCACCPIPFTSKKILLKIWILLKKPNKQTNTHTKNCKINRKPRGKCCSLSHIGPYLKIFSRWNNNLIPFSASNWALPTQFWQT
jgi:hypothetical protein